jgi:hypothetical protein
MFHVRKVSKEKRHPELRNGGARILLELSRVSRIVLRGENLHRDGNLIDVTFGEKRRVADGDAVDQWLLVLAGSEAECGPPAVTKPDRADEGIYEVMFGSAVKVDESSSGKGEQQFSERIVQFFCGQQM